MSILQVSDLHRGYGRREVLQGLTFDIDTPRFVGIIGANGCGKTTLLKTLSGYLPPWRGQILLDSCPIQSLSKNEKAKKMAFVPQDTYLDLGFSCYDLVMMGRTPYLKRLQRERQSDREAVKQAMAATKTEDYKDIPISDLSGGERQRVLIARALAQEPKLLLLDEPVSHLDIKHQAGILSLLQSLTHQGVLVLAVLHDINLASQFCDEIMIMKEGAILARGASPEVLTRKNIALAYSLEVDVLEGTCGHNPYIIPRLNKTGRLRVV